MKNSSLPESADGFPIAADGLRVEYYVKVTGATGPFMDYRGIFDLPRAFGAVDLDVNLNDSWGGSPTTAQRVPSPTS